MSIPVSAGKRSCRRTFAFRVATVGTYLEMVFGGAHVRIRPRPHPVQWGRRAVPGALVLVLLLVAAAAVASPASATASRHHHSRLKERFRPKIVGETRVGVALRATRGVWTRPRPFVYKYTWFRCAASGTKCRPIAGAAKPLYVPATQDVGTTLRVTVTARNAAGSARATSRPTLAVLATPPAVASFPTVSGTAQDGRPLTAGPGIWSGTQPINYGYQWQRCSSSGANCSPIAGATTTTYTPTSTDVGSTVKVTITASNMASSAIASSAPTARVRALPGVVALWHMDETSGATMFDSAGTHNGTLHSTQMGLPGFTGTSYGFNGSSSYVDVPSTDDLNPGNADITFTIHFKSAGTAPPPPADWDIFRKGLYTTHGGEWKMEFQQSGQASCGFKGTGGYAELVAGPKINDGRWHTISCVKTSTAIQVVGDGQAFSKAATLGSITNTTDVAIGARPGSDWYAGQLDEASVQIG
jgi:Concanavalin A-like lectin/glucanases superfamily/Ig domain of plant-specific actin-binding protein